MTCWIHTIPPPAPPGLPRQVLPPLQRPLLVLRRRRPREAPRAAGRLLIRVRGAQRRQRGGDAGEVCVCCVFFGVCVGGEGGGLDAYLSEFDARSVDSAVGTHVRFVCVVCVLGRVCGGKGGGLDAYLSEFDARSVDSAVETQVCAFRACVGACFRVCFGAFLCVSHPPPPTPPPCPRPPPQAMLSEPRRVVAHYAAGEGEEGEEQKARRGGAPCPCPCPLPLPPAPAPARRSRPPPLRLIKNHTPGLRRRQLGARRRPPSPPPTRPRKPTKHPPPRPTSP